MATNREDQPVESDNDLAPMTIKVGDTTVDDDDGDDDMGDSPPAAAAAPAPGATAPTPTGRPQPGVTPRDPRRGTADRPSKAAWKAMQEVNAVKQQMAEMRGMLQAQQQMRQAPANPAAPQQTPHEQQLNTINEMMAAIINQSANSSLSPEDRQKLGTQFNKLEGDRREIEKRVLRDDLKKEIMQEMQQTQPDPQAARYGMVLAQEFPEMVDNARATAVAKAYYAELLRENGGRDSLGLLREACAWTCKSLSLGQSRQNSMGRAAMSGGGSMNGARRDYDDGSDPDRITFSPEQLRVMQGAPVSPRQVAEYMAEQKRGRM